MRKLTLLRHAKSSRDDEQLADFARPLAPRGRKAAPLIGRHMRSLGLEPDLVLCSPAERTRETAALVLPALEAGPLPVTYDESLYEASAELLMERLRRVPDSIGHLLLIGHNPGLQDLVLALVGKLPEEHTRIAQKLPTGALVVLVLAAKRWRDIRPGKAKITHHVQPRDLAR
jgi:phosphohistidine phosphatase